MVITCSNCGARFNVKQEKIKPSTKLRCLKCKTSLDLKSYIKQDNDTKTPQPKESQPEPVEPKVTPKEKTPKKKSGPPQKGGSPTGVVLSGRKTNRPELDKSRKLEPKKSFSVATIKIPTIDVEKKVSKGAPPWIVTFADLSTLMLTFFVLLLSFANMDIVAFKEMLGSVQDAFGVQKKMKGQYQATLQGSKTIEKETDSVSTSKKDAKEVLENMTQEIKNSIESAGKSKAISITAGAHGVKVRIKGQYLFDAGSATLKSESFPFLRSIAHVINKFPFKLKVEGHTDNRPISTPQFPSNWELSAIRATTVLRFFVEQNGVDKLRLIATGYADNKPIAPNEEAWGRAKNRRVEFVFYK